MISDSTDEPMSNEEENKRSVRVRKESIVRAVFLGLKIGVFLRASFVPYSARQK